MRDPYQTVEQLAAEIVQTIGAFKKDFWGNPHNLRHTFATWLTRSGASLSVVQKILGHENVNTTLKYYVHTGDHELAAATAHLRGRPAQESIRAIPDAECFNVIPFPHRQVS